MHRWKKTKKKRRKKKEKKDKKNQLKQAKLDEKNLVKKNKEIVKMKLKKEENEKKINEKNAYLIKLKKSKKEYNFYNNKLDNDFTLSVHNTFAWYEKFDLQNDKTMRYTQDQLNHLKDLAISNLLEESFKTLVTKRSAAQWFQDEKKKKP